MKHTFLLLLATTILCSCENPHKDAEKFEKLLETSTGQDHSLVKYRTEEGKAFRVYKNEVTGEYTAYNLENYDRKKMSTMESYLATAGSSSVVRSLEVRSEWVVSGHYYDNSSCDSDGYCTGGVTDEWIDTSGYVNFYYAGGFRFSNNQGSGHDLETIAALQEDLAISFMSNEISSSYSLSNARASELAQMTYRYKKMENHRELTSAEKDAFAIGALGLSLKDVERALREKSQGKEETYRSLLEKSAAFNRTTPEKIGQFFEDHIIDD